MYVYAFQRCAQFQVDRLACCRQDFVSTSGTRLLLKHLADKVWTLGKAQSWTGDGEAYLEAYVTRLIGSVMHQQQQQVLYGPAHHC